jgi:hypothetical protein
MITGPDHGLKVSVSENSLSSLENSAPKCVRHSVVAEFHVIRQPNCRIA